jgi:hypothetical protein
LRTWLASFLEERIDFCNDESHALLKALLRVIYILNCGQAADSVRLPNWDADEASVGSPD